jgi:hypothetical protein
MPVILPSGVVVNASLNHVRISSQSLVLVAVEGIIDSLEEQLLLVVDTYVLLRRDVLELDIGGGGIVEVVSDTGGRQVGRIVIVRLGGFRFGGRTFVGWVAASC